MSTEIQKVFLVAGAVVLTTTRALTIRADSTNALGSTRRLAEPALDGAGIEHANGNLVLSTQHATTHGRVICPVLLHIGASMKLRQVPEIMDRAREPGFTGPTLHHVAGPSIFRLDFFSLHTSKTEPG